MPCVTYCSTSTKRGLARKSSCCASIPLSSTSQLGCSKALTICSLLTGSTWMHMAVLCGCTLSSWYALSIPNIHCMWTRVLNVQIVLRSHKIIRSHKITSILVAGPLFYWALSELLRGLNPVFGRKDLWANQTKLIKTTLTECYETPRTSVWENGFYQWPNWD